MVHCWTLLSLFFDKLLSSSAQQTAKNKLQNRLNLINRTTPTQNSQAKVRFIYGEQTRH